MYKLNKLFSTRLCGIKKIQNLIKAQKANFSDELNMPVIDFKKFLDRSEGWEKECKITAECLHDTGILCVKDPVSNMNLLFLILNLKLIQNL
jgi:ABC-type Na+ transport system ATPase subunit NatA